MIYKKEREKFQELLHRISIDISNYIMDNWNYECLLSNMDG